MSVRFCTDALVSRPWSFIALIVIGLLIVALPPTVAAQETPGTLFAGIGFIDDHSVEDGVVVEAWIGGRPVAATEIFNQGFILHVPEPPGESFDGEIVRFKFGGLETDGTADWVDGSETYIDLYAYTGLKGDGGNETAAAGPEDINTTMELYSRLLALELELSELAAELDRRLEINIANITHR